MALLVRVIFAEGRGERTEVRIDDPDLEAMVGGRFMNIFEYNRTCIATNPTTTIANVREAFYGMLGEPSIPKRYKGVLAQALEETDLFDEEPEGSQGEDDLAMAFENDLAKAVRASVATAAAEEAIRRERPATAASAPIVVDSDDGSEPV